MKTACCSGRLLATEVISVPATRVRRPSLRFPVRLQRQLWSIFIEYAHFLDIPPATSLVVHFFRKLRSIESYHDVVCRGSCMYREPTTLIITDKLYVTRRQSRMLQSATPSAYVLRMIPSGRCFRRPWPGFV